MTRHSFKISKRTKVSTAYPVKSPWQNRAMNYNYLCLPGKGGSVSKREQSIGADTLPVFPNSVPYNELLLRGSLSAKTRNWPWRHVGPVLLYTSTSRVPVVLRAHGIDHRDVPTRCLVGIGRLCPVRGIKPAEARRLEREFANGHRNVAALGCGEPVRAGYYLYRFTDLRRFKAPIPFKPPRGAVRTFRAPLSLVKEAIAQSGFRL